MEPDLSRVNEPDDPLLKPGRWEADGVLLMVGSLGEEDVQEV